MEVIMPYGKVLISTREEATHFMTHACENCNQNNLMNACSGAQAAKCNEKKDMVIRHFKN